MALGKTIGLSDIINARGTFTPLGVSRSHVEVQAAVATVLGAYVLIEGMQEAVSAHLVEFSGAEAGTVVHCAAAAVTLAVAACMTMENADAVARLPDADGLARRVLLPACHNVNYGQPIEQAVRLAGGQPNLVGTKAEWDLADLGHALSHDDICCLLLVSSRLTGGNGPDMAAAVALAKDRNIPVIIDGAAQDMRVRQLVSTGADLVILSGQKYLAGPTAGLVVGSRAAVTAVRAQEKGIGRGMKASKEAIAGTIAALEIRANLDIETWQIDQTRKLERFIHEVRGLPGVETFSQPDPTGLPFARVVLELAPEFDAGKVIHHLQSFDPPIFVMDHMVRSNKLVLEITSLREDELDYVTMRLKGLLTQRPDRVLRIDY